MPRPFALRILTSLFAILTFLPLSAEEDTCLMFVCQNPAKGGSQNYYLYHILSETPVPVAPGDVLEYEVFLYPKQPGPFGGLDLIYDDDSTLRDSGAKDQNGLMSHGAFAIDPASGKWYRREIGLVLPAGGRTTKTIDIQAEGDGAGIYIQFLDNIAFRRADGSKTVIYVNGAPPADRIDWTVGYSTTTILRPVPRAVVRDDGSLEAFIDRELRDLRLEQMASEHAGTLERLKQFMTIAGETQALAAVDEAIKARPDANTFAGTPSEFRAVLDDAVRRLAGAHPTVKRFTGHLIGHAHIDLQWLWEWSETIQICKDTFGQMIRFMEQYPGFTFNQSSPCLYQATAEHHPALYEKIRDYVKKGQWEIAGGRWCEADEHMTSSESNARHFLLGQRWYRKAFGRPAVTGWEPDTFGHTPQMPQMLRLAGIEDYYFCRGGKKVPLFWWEGLDGSRVLAFEESATNSWYNDTAVGSKQVQEVLDFRKLTGAYNALWVYGVGNHGGGPTKELIEGFLGFQKDPLKPSMKFSTAGDWFKAVRSEKDLREIPVLAGELNEQSDNNFFFGTYTTHGDIKRLNRDAEALTVQAETVAAVASRSGFPCPKAVFERSWRDILWNHHHDTLTGTSIHASYELSHQVLRRAIESDRRILDDALAHLAARVKRPEAPEGRAVLVFNTLAWRRDAVVEIENDTTFYPPGGLVAAAPSGETTPVQFSGNRRFLFVARDLPACGYRVYVIRPRTEAEAPKAVAAVKDRGTKLAGGRFELEIDPAKGTITRLRDTQLNRDWITPDKPGNKLVSYLEKPHGMSAWVIGDFAGAEEPEDGRALVPKLEQKAWEEGPVRAGVKLERRYRKSTIRQEILVYRDLDRIDFQLEVEWNERGGDGKPSPFLKVEFPIAVANPKARYEVPFGSLERAMGSKEQPALQWADLSGDGGGVALLNDCKHGYQAKDGTLRLSLLRSSYEPDHEPDLGRHVIRYALVPHAGGIHEAGVPKKGYEFNHKPLAVWVGGVSSPRSDAAAPALPAERSFLEVTGDGVIPTALKLAEDDNDWIVRFYQSSGTPATAKVATPFAVKSAQAVNFLEDPQGPADPAAVPLRGFEIKTLKLKAE